ncbi:MAG: type II secretion system protein GspG [Planctomycetes bacterium]|nr:type II secretion system protein GspG [Planctomycetota bacterium]
MKRRKRTRCRRAGARHGFTLMEVLLVLAILVILGTLVVTNFSGVFAGAKIKAAKAQLNAFEAALDIYQLDIGTYPTNQQGLQALRVAPPDLLDPTKWQRPYLKKDIPPDPWGNPYQYEMLGAEQYRVYSVGPDGQPDTEDDVITTSG